MEMEFFVPPGEAGALARVLDAPERMDWYTRLAMHEDHLRLRAHDADELSHYSSATSMESYPIGWAGARGDRQPRRLRPQAARRVLAGEARVLRLGHRRALRPARDRARRRRRPLRCSPFVRRLRRGPAGRREAHGAQAASGARAGEGRRAPAGSVKDGQPEVAREIYNAARAHVGGVRRGRLDRQALPPPGRDRHALRGSRSITRRSRTAPSRCATATRSSRCAWRSTRSPAELERRLDR